MKAKSMPGASRGRTRNAGSLITRTRSVTPARSQYRRARSVRARSGSIVSMRPPGGNALAIHRVEKPIAVPISSTRLGARAVTSTRNRRPAAGLTIGTPSLRPVLSISSRIGPSGGWTPSRYSRSRSVVSMRHLERGEVIQGSVPVPQTGSGGQRAREIVASLRHRVPQIEAHGQPGGDRRRKCTAGAVGTGRHDPGSTILMDTLAVDEQVDDRIVLRVAAFDHDCLRSQLHDGAGRGQPLVPSVDPSPGE